MSSKSFNSQFLTIDFRLLDHPRYCGFMRGPSFSVYMQLRRYVWRSTKKEHPFPQVNELYAEGHLVAAVPREVLARKTGVRRLASVSSQLAGLEKLGVIRIVRTGRQNVYLLGTWEDRSLAGDGSYVSEFFFLDQVFGPEPFEAPRLDDLPPGLSETSEAAPNRTAGRRPPRGGSGGGARANRTSGGALHRTSDVRCGDPLNKETNREGKRRRGAFEPVDDRERADDAIYVEY